MAGRTWFRTVLYGIRSVFSDGVAVPERNAINFIGASIVDNPLLGATDITLNTALLDGATSSPAADTLVLRDSSGGAGFRQLTVSNVGGDYVQIDPDAITVHVGGTDTVEVIGSTGTINAAFLAASNTIISSGAVQAVGNISSSSGSVTAGTSMSAGTTITAGSTVTGTTFVNSAVHTTNKVVQGYPTTEYDGALPDWVSTRDTSAPINIGMKTRTVERPTFLLPLDLPNGSILKEIHVWVKPNTHGSWPGSFEPATWTLFSIDPTNPTAVMTTHATATDTVGLQAAYEAAHEISVTGLTIPMAETTRMYFIRFTGECNVVDGVPDDAVAGFIYYGTVLNYQIPAFTNYALLP